MWKAAPPYSYALVVFMLASVAALGCSEPEFTAAPADTEERLREVIDAAGGAASLRLPDADDLNAIPQDPRNPLTPAKVELGRLLFHETALAVNPVRPEGRGTYSCASCHNAGAGFQAGRRQAIGEGGVGFGHAGEGRTADAAYGEKQIDAPRIRTSTVLNAAWQRVMHWNGQFGAGGPNTGTEALWTPSSESAVNRLGYEGLESQAIAALSTHRMKDGAAAVAAAYPVYRDLFDAAFPERSAGERVSAETAGLAIAAYERTVVASKAPFQRWLRGDDAALTLPEKRGALVFFGKGACTTCHTGPSLASTSFHALGMGDLAGPDVLGPDNPFSILPFGRSGFTERDEDRFRFKTPQLYNLADHVAFGHGGTFATVRDVVVYKNEAVAQSRYVSASQLSPHFQPLKLTEAEIDDLTAFLERGLYDADLQRHVPEAVPSGQCFPVNDPQSRRDLGCGDPDPTAP